MTLFPLSLVVLLVLLGFVLYYFFGSFAFGAGFEPSSRSTVRSMLRLAEVGPSDTLVDLGAGTGAIVFRALRERDARAIAVEKEPVRYLILRARRWGSRARDRMAVRREDLFQTPLGSATVVTLFLWPSTIARLRTRMESELAPGTRVVSYYHRIEGWRPTAQDVASRVFLYRVPESIPSAVAIEGGR